MITFCDEWGGRVDIGCCRCGDEGGLVVLERIGVVSYYWGCIGLEIGDWGIRCGGVVVWCGVVWCGYIGGRIGGLVRSRR